MLNVIDRALADAAKAAREQTEQLLNELNSASECMMAAKLIFERDMTEARKLHELAARKEGEALRNFDASLIQLNSILVALKRQLADGEIVTGIAPHEERTAIEHKPDEEAEAAPEAAAPKASPVKVVKGKEASIAA